MSIDTQSSTVKLEEDEVKPETLIAHDEPVESRKRKLEPETVPVHMRALTKCCVCEEWDQKYQMTLAPKMKKVLLKWSQVFGTKFFEICSGDKANHYICAIHWKQLRDDWEGPLPEVLEKMKKENNGSFKITMYLNDIDEEGKDNFVKERIEYRVCRYCGAKCLDKDTTKVPKNEQVLKEWTKRLGQQFAENIEKYKENMICWSHFEYRENQRSAHNLPIPDGNIIEKAKNDGTEKCRYCNEKREKWKMVSVPEDSTKLARWVEKLGPIFSENLEKNEANYICWSHFCLPNMLKSSYMKYLPVADKDLGFSNKNQPAIEGKNLSKPTRRWTNDKVICRYCGASCLIKSMTQIPKDGGKLMEWVKILGEEFRRNISIYKNNRICLSHFPCGVRIHEGVENLPIADLDVRSCEDGITKVEESEDEKPDVKMLKTDIKMENPADEEASDKTAKNLVPDYACSTYFSPEELVVIKEE